MLGRWPTAELLFHDIDGLLERMDQLGIARAVVSHSDAWQYDPIRGNARLMETLAAQTPSIRDRLIPCLTIVPTATNEHGSMAALSATLDDTGIACARLIPHDHNYVLSSPESAAWLDLLARKRIATLIDADQTSWSEIDRICGEHPDLILVVCRVGYRALRQMAGVLERRLNCHIDLSYFGSHQGVEWIVERFGSGRLLFGTGAPLVDGGGSVARLMLSDIRDEDRAAIGSGNLASLLSARAPGSIGASATERRSSAEVTDGDLPADQVRRGSPIANWDVVDAHAHIGPWFNFFTPEPEPEAVVRVMDRCGVRFTVVSSLLGVGPDAAAGNVEMIDLVTRCPDRFAGYAIFNPHHAGSADDVERALALPGVVGIKIHPDTHASPVEGPAYAPAWELASKHAVPVLSHTFAGSPWCDPAHFRAVAERWPEAHIILGHAGVTEDGHRRSVAVALDHPNLYLELCGSLTTGALIRFMVDAVGAERVLYGSDAPFIDMRYGLGRVVFAGLSPDELALVLGGNARRLLKLPKH